MNNTVTLGDYLKTNDVTQRVFAGRAGCSQAMVGKLLNHGSVPGKALGIRIYVATGGAVRPDTFYDLPDLTASAAVEEAAA